MKLTSLVGTSVELSDSAAAQSKAVEEAAATGGQALPAVLFRQGTRAFASTALPMGVIRERVIVREASRAGDPSAVLSNANRPVMPDHARAIARFVKTNMNKPYILPPMT
jgi:hypothetical protein